MDARSGRACSCKEVPGPCAGPAHAAAPDARAGASGAALDPCAGPTPGQRPGAWTPPAALQQAAAQGAAEHPGDARGGAAGDTAGDLRLMEKESEPLLVRVVAGLLLVEAALPREALAPDWSGSAWRQVGTYMWATTISEVRITLCLT